LPVLGCFVDIGADATEYATDLLRLFDVLEEGGGIGAIAPLAVISGSSFCVAKATIMP
jgi:hypothetical protein